MKLSEALEIINQPAADPRPLKLFLATGFSPLHLKSFLIATLKRRLQRTIEIEEGIFGDLIGNLERLKDREPNVAIVVIEWTDLDPRLGNRTVSGWNEGAFTDIRKEAARRLHQLYQRIASGARHCPIALALPSLGLPPLFSTPIHRAAPLELELQRGISTFARRLSKLPAVSVMSRDPLSRQFNAVERADITSELRFGFPYSLPFAAALAEKLGTLAAPPPPKKGLITDLDDTLWSGILGEEGLDKVRWQAEAGSAQHAWYQALLNSLASSGIFLGVATRNDPKRVKEALDRTDLIVNHKHFFPIEAGWGAKSAAVGRILKAWNISADSVVFVDDSANEIEEVKLAFPGIECLRFPSKESEASALLWKLRELFGKEAGTREDKIRVESLRGVEVWDNVVKSSKGGIPPEEFLKESRAEITLSCEKFPSDPRALELLNKTNQFNLNGRRYTEGEWQKLLSDPNRFLLVAEYEDKFGPLGRIAILTGTLRGEVFHLDGWAMSCRAFGRTVEYQSLQQVFNLTGANHVQFEYQATARNQPLTEFLEFLLGPQFSSRPQLAKEAFRSKCPRLYHRMKGASQWKTSTAA